jgi:hypothetical protein
VGLRDGFRRWGSASSRRAPAVYGDLLDEDVRWIQAFQWGLLIAHDDLAAWDVPSHAGKGHVVGNMTCLAIPVRQAQDVVVLDDFDRDPTASPPQAQVAVVLTMRRLELIPDYEGRFRCPSGVLQVGDAAEHRSVQVPPGELSVAVWLESEKRADRVIIALQRGR